MICISKSQVPWVEIVKVKYRCTYKAVEGVFTVKAYVISECEVLNEDLANEYGAHAAASIDKYGGQYLAVMAKPKVVEGKSTKQQIVIVEFPSLERAQKWYESPDYAEALKLREKALDRRLMFIEGVAPPVH